MTRRFSALALAAGLCAAALVVAATPAYAQLGSLTGKVVDEAGKPVPDAEVSLDFTGEMSLHFKVKTDKNGTWTRAGLIAVGGRWNITAKKGNLTGGLSNIEVALGGAKPVDDIVLRSGGSATVDEATSKKNEEARKLIAEANAALTANNYDVAVAKLTEATTKTDKCIECFVSLGDIYLKQSNPDKAEEAYKQAIALDDKNVSAYDGLAIVYNTQKKLDEAAAATNKAMELRSATGGPVDPMAAYNAGVVFWNQNKFPEAKAQFQKAVQAKPDMADAQYYLGMCLLNEGNTADAKTALQAYMKLAPTGANAPTAKAILDEMK
ncbi:MAG TPA: tetratricopeptide repeat protein [Vicinamibacterales bacterium]|jgi:tetratricopeptide (TPR) repeat protein|nr:tetratricopeptide repeat protein [Vicinamibacterales bacterium]